MKVLKKLVVWLIFLLVGIQWIPSASNQSISIPEMDFLSIYNASDKLSFLMKTSCYDCHSNNTFYPWYSRIQPMRLIMDRHVKNGKKELNFNEFMGYSSRRKKSKLKSIISQLNKKEMPLNSYTLLHREARLTEIERELLIEWINKIKDSLKNNN